MWRFWCPRHGGKLRWRAAGRNPARPVVRQEGSKRFFFEKKNQKTFMTLAPRVQAISPPHENQMDKSFLLLFFKKEALAFFNRQQQTPESAVSPS
jgi:hypothetical protein